MSEYASEEVFRDVVKRIQEVEGKTVALSKESWEIDTRKKQMESQISEKTEILDEIKKQVSAKRTNLVQLQTKKQMLMRQMEEIQKQTSSVHQTLEATRNESRQLEQELDAEKMTYAEQLFTMSINFFKNMHRLWEQGSGRTIEMQPLPNISFQDEDDDEKEKQLVQQLTNDITNLNINLVPTLQEEMTICQQQLKETLCKQCLQPLSDTCPELSKTCSEIQDTLAKHLQISLEWSKAH